MKKRGHRETVFRPRIICTYSMTQHTSKKGKTQSEIKLLDCGLDHLNQNA